MAVGIALLRGVPERGPDEDEASDRADSRGKPSPEHLHPAADMPVPGRH
jgi:hypothetical protein